MVLSGARYADSNGTLSSNTRGGQPRPRPDRLASTMSMAAWMAASISKCVVSSKCASGARLKGAAARFWSRSSRFGYRRAQRPRQYCDPAPCTRPAPAGADLGRRRDVNLHIRVRTNDGADVPAVEHSARRPGGEFALEGKERFAHLGNCRSDRRSLADAVGPAPPHRNATDQVPLPRRPPTSPGLCPASINALATAR